MLSYTRVVCLLTFSTLAASSFAGDYQRRLINNYHGQLTDFYCGPATAQMILDSDSSGSATLPPNPFPTQDQLWTKIQATKNAANNFATDPQGLAATLNFYDNGHNYVAYSMNNFDAATRTLAFNVDNYSIPGGVLVGQGAHWISINGSADSVKPALAGVNSNFTVDGFYGRDPWSGFKPGKGLGKNVYLANTPNGLWKKSFTPVQNVKPSWKTTPYTGKYAFVADPDEDDISTVTTPTAAASSAGTESAAQSLAGTDISNDDGGYGDSDLSNIPSFENGAFSSNGATEFTSEADDNGSDWLIPYYQSGDLDTPSGAVLIDEATGALDAAFWDDGVLDGDSLSSLDQLVLNEEGDSIVIDNFVPEPASLSVLALGAAALVLRRRK